MFRALCIVLTVFFVAQSIYSVPLEDLINPNDAAMLRTNEYFITSIKLRNPSLTMLPKHPLLQQAVNETFKSLGPSVTVESLNYFKKPQTQGYWTSEQKIELFNRMLSLSTLAGIKYMSESRGEMRIFYELSHVIDSPEGKKQLPDPVFDIPPLSLTIYARQKDLTFGDNIYRYDYTTAGDILFFVQENLTPLNYGVIPAIGRNRLRSVVAVIDCDDCLLIYVVSMVRAASIPGMGNRIGKSFGNRVEAIFEWFMGKINDVFD